MAHPVRIPAFVNRHSLLKLALVALAGFSCLAQAQTAPQLLPYTAKLIAGGGPTATFTVGQTCPVAGAPNVATDVYGDGCLATEVQLGSSAGGPRYAIEDAKGNIFISDYSDGLVRRVDAVTGIVTAVAGGATSSPTTGATCGSYKSTDIFGDGCLSTAVKLGRPAGLAFDAAGNLYFADPYDYNVRKIAATGGLVPATGGIVTLVAGDNGGTTETYGYTSDFGTTNIVAATSSYLDGPEGLAFDSLGNLYIADYYKNALLVVNTNATGSTTVTGVTIPAGTIAKIAGTITAGGTVCPNSPASTNGCNYGLWVDGSPANSSLTDDPWAPSFDSAGNVYFANEYEDNVGIISPSGILKNFAGEQGSLGKSLANTKRAVAGTFAIGTAFGVSVDSFANVYIPDSTNGFLWRVDGPTKSMYVVGGGASTVCAAATDTVGDGCPALQATFSSNGTYGSTSATTASGVYGVFIDPNANLIVADQKNNLVREIASGTQFGIIGANQPTDIVEVHFAAGDKAATTNPFTIATGSTYFSVGTPTCTTNSDTTTDCLVPVKATVTATGTYTGTLVAASANNGSSTFPLSATVVTGPKTSTTVSATVAACPGIATVTTTTPVTLTATLISNGPSTPTGTFNFYANGSTTPLNSTPIALANLGTSGAPVYGATFTYTFATAGTYSISASYSGNSYYIASTSSAPATIATATPTFSLAPTPYAQGTVSPGQTALYSFTMPSIYVGTVSFAVTGLPANSSYTLNPTGTLSLSGCQTTYTYALSILTQQQTTVQPGGFGTTGNGPWQLMAALAGLGLALLIGLRRRNLRFGQIWMALALLLAASGTLACGKTVGSTIQPATPAGTYTITVTATGSAGSSPAPITFTLTVL